MGKEPGAAGISQQVFCEVLARRLVVIEDRSFWKIKFKSAQVPSVAVAAGHKRNLDRIAFSGSYHVDFQPVEIPAFATARPR